MKHPQRRLERRCASRLPRPALAAGLLFAAGFPALAQAPAPKPAPSTAPAKAAQTRSTLRRQESPVIVQGRRLKPALKKPKDALRLYAWRGGRLTPIPYQIDERTPEGSFAFPKGEVRRTDTDEGSVDDNDELVFMARDVGDRAPKGAIRLGQTELTELVVSDSKGRGWVYLLYFAKAPPPRAKGLYVGLDWRRGDLLGWTGHRTRVALGKGPAQFLDLRQLRFARKQGGFGADVLDRAKLDLRLGYLFLDIRRRLDEVRAAWISHRQGPVRALAGYEAETYMIWGHWLKATRSCLMTVYGNRLELASEFRLPVDLEKTRPSSLRFSLDFDPAAAPIEVWSNRNPVPLRLDGKGRDPKLRKLKTSRAEWVIAAVKEGAILARLHLDPALQKRRHRLFLRDEAAADPPEDFKGSVGNVGFELDLTGLTAGTYRFRVTLHFTRSVPVGGEVPLLRIEDAPLKCEPAATPAKGSPKPSPSPEAPSPAPSPSPSRSR